MASTSGQEFNSNQTYRRWLAETFDGHETAEDDLLAYPNGHNDNMEPCIGNLPTSLEPLEPYVGMEFESAEDAREFYEMYGRHLGFTIRNNRTRRSLKDSSIIGREFVCSKEGFRKREKRIIPSRPATREGCNALLRIAAKDGGKWVIYGFVKEHNHELNPSKVPPRRSHRVAFSESVAQYYLIHSLGSSLKSVPLSFELSLLIVVLHVSTTTVPPLEVERERAESCHDGSEPLMSGLWRCSLGGACCIRRGRPRFDEKDLKIRELSTELHRERKRSAAYQEQLQMILKYVEEHTQQLSLNVQAVFNQVRQIESEEQDDLDSD
ncbi:hypothetical protein RHSIM_Rhsim09G0026800 [Rhododendron simsii]|uniref:FAR1 domain-containing protein n=1 Tax=Rhododendron simsii TaxID=118357 RepID=A0A834GGE6_RHOSS|nr:hypothetical protein RHSIM_Rhsim09G0026800 [Rhododendron simsii]